MYFLFTVGSSFFIWCRVYFLQYYSWHGTKRLHENMLERVLNAPINLYFDTTPVGRILNKFSRDLSIIEMFFVYIIGTFYVYLYNLLSIVVLSCIVIPWVIFFFPVVGFVCWKLFRHTVAATKEVNRIASVTKSPILSYLSESISGSSTIRAFEKREDFKENQMKLLNKNILANQYVNGVPNWFAIRIDVVSVIAMLFICVLCVAARFSTDPILLAMLLTYSLTLQTCVVSSIRLLMDIESRMVNTERCFSVLKIPQEYMRGDLPIERFKQLNPDWPSRGEVKFDSVVLKYRPTTEVVLNNLSFVAQPGEKIGVVGRTGAGKSTICLSMSRIVEIVEGAIFIDGQNIRSVDLHYLRSRITVIPQDPTMFTGTLRFNLDPENRVDDGRILDVLREAGLEDLILRHDDGLYQPLSENG